MARIVFSLTTAQIKTLAAIAKSGEPATYADYGSARGLVAKGWAKVKKRHAGGAWSWRERYELTPRGRVVLRLVRVLKLDKIPPAAAPRAAAELVT